MTPRLVDLTNCDREPIHIPGSIQPHGCLLALDATATTVLRHSANAPDMLGVEGDLNGRDLNDLAGSEAAHTLRNALSSSKEGARPSLLLDVKTASGRRFDVSVHRFKANTIVEFERAGDSVRPLESARELIGRLAEATSVERLMAQGARLARMMLGYDRVMVYRFQPDGAGKVIAEVKRAELESFLGQYFPASDIPQQARALYLRNTIRVITDAGNARVALVPELDASGEPLDLSFAHLRSVSPVHCEYLRNMGVAASMSISIIVDGELWGLIACHHYSPRVLPMALRVAMEMFGEFFALHLRVIEQRQRLDGAEAARRALDRFLHLASHHADMAELLGDSLPDFAALIPCDGIGLWIGGTWTWQGATPPRAAVPGLAEFVGRVSEGKIWATHALSQRHAAAQDFADEASGLLAIPLSQIPRDYLFFFRKELVQTLEWAGNPDKSYETGPLGDRLTPRKSFAIWKETVHRQAQPWTEADRQTAEAARAAIVEVVLRHNELMVEERARADVRQRMLNEELNHRVKNILAVIKSLVGHPVSERRSLASYVATLKGRIQALAVAHDQIVRGDGGGMLVDLLNAELTPYRAGAQAITFEGAGVWLDARAFSVLALVLHELATNAAKYGALSVASGCLAVTWRLSGAGDLDLEWRESDGPIVSRPTREGFGTALVHRSVPYDLDGRASVDYAPSGLVARFTVPARHVTATAASAREVAVTAEKATRTAVLPPDVKVLVLEDQMLIAMDVEAMMEDAGAARVVVTNSAEEALARLRGFAPDVAVLDVNLGHGTSVPVAEELDRRRIPFVFATGYGDALMIPDSLRKAPIVRKPYEGRALAAALVAVLDPE